MMIKTSVSMICLLLLGGCTGQIESSITSNNQNQEIINGELVKSSQIFSRSTVGVYDIATGELCTGTLILDNVVLTAAHCIGPNPEKMAILFGSRLDQNSSIKHAKKVKVSPYWESNKNNRQDTGDIALIQFEGCMPSGYTTAKLINSSNNLKGATTTVVGYGIDNPVGNTGDGILRMTHLTIKDPSFSFTESEVDQSGGTGACHGDSGGPAFVQIENEFYLWGLVARGINDPKNLCNTSAIFTNVFRYRGWIQRTLQEFRAPLVYPYGRE